MPVFGVIVSVMFHLACVNIILVQFWSLSGHLWEIAATRLTICSLCSLTICNFC